MRYGSNFTSHVEALKHALASGTLPTEHDIRYLTVLRHDPHAIDVQAALMAELSRARRRSAASGRHEGAGR